MPRTVAIAIVHGIYAENSTFSDTMQDLLRAALPPNLRAFVKFQPVFWGDIVRPHTKHFLQQAEAISGMQRTAHRRFIVEGLGDAAAYQKTFSRHNSAYYRIQHKLTEALATLESHDDPNRPLVFIGHSLGCHIVSTYAWDICRLRQMSDADLRAWNDPEVTAFVAQMRQWSPMRRLDTFVGFVTMGSNMPLFTFTFGPDNVYPITRAKDVGKDPAFPGRELPPGLVDRARWLNFYSASDLLGYPLRPLNDAFRREERLEDIVVCSEGRLRAMFLPQSLNALSAHLGYWTNRAVVRRIARFLASIIDAPDDALSDQAATGPMS